MNAFHRSLLIAACLFGAGCSALSDFGGYEFNGPETDGGMGRDDGGSGEGSAGEGGDSGEGGAGAGGDSGGGAGAGGESGEGGAGAGGDSGEGGGGDGGDAAVEPECTAATESDDCEATELCVNEMCVPIRIPSGVLQSAGGGDTSSTNYSMRVSAGVPQPMGRVSSTNFIVTVGPGAGRP
jgi:hypothetical protein